MLISKELLDSCIATPAYELEAKVLGIKRIYEEEGHVLTFYIYKGRILIDSFKMAHNYLI